MLFYTHLIFSVFAGLFLVDYLSVSNKPFFFLFLVLFASLPDIDKANSKIGRNFGFLSKLVNFIFGHRKFFHSFLFIAFFYILLSLFSNLVALSFLIATLSHLILDALTPEGIMPFYPLNWKVNWFIRTGSLVEKALFLVILVLFVIELTTGHP